MAITGGTVETLDDIPANVWNGLPDCLHLGPSDINQSRIGVWATKIIPKGKRFGPFVGDKKKRSQVTSNVYMWEVYFPARGWMCIDATDPMKGNWLRYVNWARSSEEQNLFPLEINRSIYYKVLRPISAGEELLVWYTREDNPEITAALEEERASTLSRKKSPRAKRARRKLLEKARQAGLGGFKKTSGTEQIVKEMWEGGEGVKEEEDRPLRTSQGLEDGHPYGNTDHNDVEDMSLTVMNRVNWEEEEAEEEEEQEEEEEDSDDTREMQQQTSQELTVAETTQNKQSGPLLTCGEESHKDSQVKLEYSLVAGEQQEVPPNVDPDAELEGEPQGESYSCPHCERHFSTRQGLERHAHIHAISNQQAQLFKCRYCNKSFGSQVGRRRHERRHESGFKKKPGFLAGAISVLSPVIQTDSSPDCTTPTSHYIAIGSQFTGVHVQTPEKKELGPHADRPLTLDENGESKELHPCKYCNKAFGTHTNMRRHQRRIHERHLLPKGVRRKGMLLQDASAQQTGAALSTSPPTVYVPSADTEDEADGDDYAVDISKNISENLSFYIDGKIVSTSAVSGCEVIEVDSRSASLFGLDTVIISQNQINQALKVEARTNVVKQISSGGQSASKRRTSTPPLVTSLKVETDTTPSSSSSSSSSSTSSSSKLLVGGLFQQATDSAAFQREKPVYLSPKLKQLLQTQDFQKSTLALITDSHRLASPLSVPPLHGASGRYKRRTASPPSSPQLSPAGKTESCQGEGVNPLMLKVPKLESHSVPPPESMLEINDGDSLSSPGNSAHSQASSSSGGNSCNQQPLDLSNSVSKHTDGLNRVLGDSALDLSLHRKSAVKPELKGNSASQSVKKKKPNTSMLEKVLMNDYVGLALPAEEGPSALTNPSGFHSRSSNTASESAHPSPPSLTPVTMNPCSPDSCSVSSPTPPPPVLPTIPSPPAMPSSPLPSDSPAQRPLPVLSPKMSPRSIEHKHSSDSAEDYLTEENKDEDEKQIFSSLDSLSTPLEGPPLSLTPSPPGPAAVDLPIAEDNVSLPATCNSQLNGIVTENETSLKLESTALSSHPELLSSSAPHSPKSQESSLSLVSQSFPQIKVKEEPQHCEDELSVTNDAPQFCPDSSPPLATPEKPSKTSEAEELDLSYCKTFVCNVCEEPFNSIKELSAHITEHATDWPYKCEFCVQLFGDAPALLTHRTTLHGVGQIFVCSVCSKEFAFLCNLQQHQKDLHPNETCSHTTVESGKIRPQNYTDISRAKEESSPSTPAPELSDENSPHPDPLLAKEEADVNGNHTEDPNEELYTTIKIMASEGGKPKGPDVRFGINQHYPSFKPPPFPYHSRSHASSVASATNFTTHNIPQTFSTAIRCTKCGNSFDNMPELHKHILACANASDKKRYTPKKNPIPLKQIVKSPNGVASPTASTAGQGAFRRMGQPKRLNFNQDIGKTKMSALSKKRNQLVQKAISQKNKAATTVKKAFVKVEEESASSVCPHCSREFTYTASLTKHMAISCPMKPVVTKKGKKGLAEVKKEAVSVVDKNTCRKKASDCDTQTEPEAKPLGKTRARSSGAADPESLQASKGKTAAKMGRLKRPALYTKPVSASKKTKKGLVQPSPHTLPALAAPSDPAQQPAARMQRPAAGKEPALKRSTETKSPPSSQQLKKEERFSLRMRERLGGPVTRSSQMANAAPPAELKPEEPPVQEPKESQELLMK
ncbi:PR domain zinc finger protein 2 [Cololabis saira]|uniref:PR domain zinc finger protein 2 n=1 Tax=Cololabis saira TaxID=129043 RepID=UPI002AD398BF|nr:PR domain zinc finger protein 2 [Cololabis saira]